MEVNKIIKAIYKIENKINHKIYIGQSNDPKKRFSSHCSISATSKDHSLIDKAIQKYGRDNFSLEILGWFEDYNEKEKYYIKYYRCLAPNGYNILKGGDEPPHYKGEEHPRSKITNETALLIQKDLLNWKIPRKQILKKYNISSDLIRHINNGNSWNNKDFQYPLRPTEKELNNIRANEVIKLLIETNFSQKEIGQKVGWNRSAVTMINIGKNHFNKNLKYPIRENKKENKELLSL